MAGPTIIVITPANVLASAAGQIVYDYLANGLGGAVILQGQLVFLRADNTWQHVSDNGGTSATDFVHGLSANQTRGMALNKAYPGQPVSVLIADTDYACGGTIVKGTLYEQYGTGTFVDYQGNPRTVNVGAAKSTTNMAIDLSSAGFDEAP